MQILETVTSAISSRMIQRVSSQSKSEGVKKWELYRHLCIAKSEFRLNDRCLTVLNSLLSFLCDDVITSKSKLVVFPSNKQISIRAHMMPESTLRRHLASLIEAGIITRKDSPNYKRYAHKNGEGEVELAFGFDFTPLFARTSEIKQVADRILDEQRAVKRMRDEVSIIRREIARVFEEVSTEATNSLFVRFRDVVNRIPRRATLTELESIRGSLEVVMSELAITLKNNDNVEEMSVNAVQYERHHKESLPESLLKEDNDFSDLKETLSEAIVQKPGVSKAPTISLDLILRACPDIQTYASTGIRSWRDLIDASHVVSVFLGISKAAYSNAVTILGPQSASAAIACILQKAEAITCPGGFLRSLVQKARAGGFCVGDMLMGNLRRPVYQ